MSGFWSQKDVKKRLENSFTTEEIRAMRISAGKVCKPRDMTDAQWDDEKARARAIADKALRQLARVEARRKIAETVLSDIPASELGQLMPYCVPRAKEEDEAEDMANVSQTPVHVEINMPGFPPAPKTIEEWDIQMRQYLEGKKNEANE